MVIVVVPSIPSSDSRPAPEKSRCYANIRDCVKAIRSSLPRKVYCMTPHHVFEPSYQQLTVETIDVH